MKSKTRFAADAVSAVLTAAIILLSTTLMAQQVAKSSIYRQSKFISMLVSQDELQVADLLKSAETVRFAAKFASAVTEAYISFELIPVYEVSTFMAVFEGMNESIAVDRFAYDRKDIIIYGEAADKDAYDDFLAALQETEHFSGISGRYYISTDNTVKFEAVCYAITAVYPDFVQQ